MSCTQGVRKALLVSLASVGLTTGVFAQTSTPSEGLGQSWPNAADMSTSPNWHVYVFKLHGIKYIQVNDLDGHVHAAVATAAGTVVVLPMGVDAQDVRTSPTNTSSNARTIYNDGATSVMAEPQSAGTTQFFVEDTCTDPVSCSAAVSAPVH